MSDIDNQSAKGRTLKAKIRKNVLFLLKIAFAAAIIWWLVSSNYGQFADTLKDFNYWFLLPAGVVYASHMFVCAWRWYALAKIIQVKLPFLEALSLTMQAYFCSLVIPGGAIGGDVARLAAVTMRAPHGAKAEGAFTILMDRIIGMVALFVLAILLVLMTLPVLMKVNIPIPGVETTDTVRIIGIIALLGLCLSGLISMLILFFHKQLRKITWIDSLMNWGDCKTHGMVFRLTDAIDRYRVAWKQLTVLTIVSVFFVHIATVVAVMFIILGVGVRNFSLLDVLTAVTIGNIAGLIPLSLSGIGLRDITICEILKASDFQDNAVIPVLYTLMILFFNMLGGLFFVIDPGARR